jgi:hypothetical protein
MAGLVPAIHDFLFKKQDVDARHKAGHDGGWLHTSGKCSSLQDAVLYRSMQVRSTSSPGLFHQSFAEKISTSVKPR